MSQSKKCEGYTNQNRTNLRIMGNYVIFEETPYGRIEFVIGDRFEIMHVENHNDDKIYLDSAPTGHSVIGINERMVND